MKFLIFIILLASPFSKIIAQKAIINEVRDTNPTSKKVYVFPLIVIPGNKKASQKINDALLSFLFIDRKDVKKSIFENVWEPSGENTIWIFRDLSYKIILNTDSVLCISTSAEYGKNLTYNTQYFLFANNTGELIRLEQLFTSEGNVALVDTLNRLKGRRLKNKIRQTQDSLAKHIAENDFEMQVRDRAEIHLYQSCMKNQSLTDLEYLGFYIQQGKLYIAIGHCASWAEYALDDLWDFKFSFLLKDLQPMFSTDGSHWLKGLF